MRGSTTNIPTCPEDIEAWVGRLQRERLGDSGRGCIALAGLLLVEVFRSIDADDNRRQRLEDRIEELDALGEDGAKKAATLEGQAARIPTRVDRLVKVSTKVTELIAKAYDADKIEATAELVELREERARRATNASRFGKAPSPTSSGEPED